MIKLVSRKKCKTRSLLESITGQTPIPPNVTGIIKRKEICNEVLHM